MTAMQENAQLLNYYSALLNLLSGQLLLTMQVFVTENISFNSNTDSRQLAALTNHQYVFQAAGNNELQSADCVGRDQCGAGSSHMFQSCPLKLMMVTSNLKNDTTGTLLPKLHVACN